MTRAAVRSARFPRLAAAAAALAFAAAACGPSPVRAHVPPAALAEAPWERSFLPEERTGHVTGDLSRPLNAPGEPLLLEPVAGARIELLLPRPDGLPPFETAGATTTAEDGTFRLDGVPDAFVLRAAAEGSPESLAGRGVRVPGILHLIPGRPIRFGVHRPVTVTGRAQTRDGRPAAGARILVASVACATEVTTGADGAFSCVVPDRRVMFTVNDPRWDTAVGATDAEGGRPEPVTIETAPVEPYSGFVLASEDGRPVEGAVVLSVDDPSQRAVTGADGRFALPVPRVGFVAAFGAGRAWRASAIAPVAEQEFRLDAAPRVTGRVVDAAGRPVEGARIIGVVGRTDRAMGRVLGPLTDRDGRFDYSWAPPRPRGATGVSSFVAFHRGLGLSDVVDVPPKGPVELRLSGWRDVRGVVVDHAGAPVGSAGVRAVWRVGALEERATTLMDVPAERVVVTDADGSFLLRRVPADRDAEVRAEVYGLSVVAPLPRGAAGDVRLALPACRDLVGRVVSSTGLPVAAAAVTAELLDTPGLQFKRTVASGADGAFRIDGAPPGRYAVQAGAPDFDLPATAEGRPGEGDVELVLRRRGLVILRPRLVGLGADERAPELTAWVDDLRSPDLPPHRIRVPPGLAGREVTLGRFAPGPVRVRIDGGPWRGTLPSLEVSDAGVHTIEVPVERTLRLRAVLRDARGAPLADERVVLAPQPGAAGTAFVARSGPGGAVDVTGIYPGTWSVTVLRRNEAPLRTTIDFPRDDVVELALPPSGTVAATVLDAAGEPRAEAVVYLSRPDGTPVSAWADSLLQLSDRFRVNPDGRARLGGVAVGRVRVHATVGAERLPAKEVDVSAGGTAEVVWR